MIVELTELIQAGRDASHSSERIAEEITRLTTPAHKDKFRGRCALALEQCSLMSRILANAIRISPMHGCTDVGAIEAVRRHVVKLNEWLDKAEESALAVQAAERDAVEHTYQLAEQA